MNDSSENIPTKETVTDSVSLASLTKLILAQQEKIDKIYSSVERSRKMFLWTIIISVALVLVPAIIMIAVFPLISSSFVGDINNLGL